MISESTFKVYNASAGSGKTFTLVKEYLKIILTVQNEFEFQKILAITFTNKAAKEMKERVLNTLKDASRERENSIVDELVKEVDLSMSQISEKSKRVLDNILHNYASFHIATIDSFTHKLIRTFSLDLGLPLDFDVEMDTDLLLQETIDILISKIGEDKELTDVLVNYALGQVNDDKSWNITDALLSVARLLLNEENEIQVSKLINTSLSDFQSLEKRLKTYLSETEKAFKQVGEQAILLIDEQDITYNSFSSSAVPNYFKKFVTGWNAVEKEMATATVQKCFDSGNFYPKTKPKTDTQQIDRQNIDLIKDELFPLYEMSRQLYKAHFGQYFLVKKILKTLTPLAVLSHINKEFKGLKEENNICVNAEFNKVISKKIKNEPVPFIYERLGEKYQYFFIDEMQDTSELQWENLIPLINNTLSHGKGSLMLVGDAKQSIYRWRGGKASQFVALSDEEVKDEFHVEKNVITLDTNYRSYSNVINFNNDFFSFMASYLKDPSYQEIYAKEKFQKTNSKEGGYVRVEVFEQEEDFVAHEVYAEKIYQMILDVESKGFSKGDICVLTRKKKDGVAVADYLVSQGIEVISPDSLLLKNNKMVQVFVKMLKWIETPGDKEILIELLYFLYHRLEVSLPEHEFYEACLNQECVEDLLQFLGIEFHLSEFFSLSLYDGMEYLIRAFKLEIVSDVFVQSFLDLILQFQLKESGSLQSFLGYWEKKRDKLKVEVSPSEDAVQIMTIHKSKGLEFPVVIFPFDLNTEDITREKVWFNTQGDKLFDGFESFQIGVSSSLSLYGDEGVQQLRNVNSEIQLDNFNLLYVALTRAEEQLYVLCDTKKGKTKAVKNYSDYFKEYILAKSTALIYELGDSKRLSEAKGKEESFKLEEFKSIDKKENQVFVVQNEYEDNDARVFGNLIHKSLERIISSEDVLLAFNYIDQQGLSLEISNQAKEIVRNVVSHSSLKEYFFKGLEVYTERSFLSKSGELVMDRLVFKEGDVVVIDYKTGGGDSSHELQIQNYANVLLLLGYRVEKKILVYCNVDNKIKIVEV